MKVLCCLLLAGLGLQPSPQTAQQAAGPKDFDFLKGQWDIVYNSKAPGIPPDVKGRWIAGEHADGRVLYDEFRLFGPDGSTVNLGVTYRIFDHVQNRWDMRYATVLNTAPGRPAVMPAGWAEMTAWREGNDIRVDQIGRRAHLRIRYYNIGPDSFSWKADVSNDGGQTWNIGQTRIEAKRVRPAAQRNPS